MDYNQFYAEIPYWITQVNEMAMKHTMDSLEFWQWVSDSIGSISDRYGNSPLVIRQLTMLYLWLEDTYTEMKKAQQG